MFCHLFFIEAFNRLVKLSQLIDHSLQCAITSAQDLEKTIVVIGPGIYSCFYLPNIFSQFEPAVKDRGVLKAYWNDSVVVRERLL